MQASRILIVDDDEDIRLIARASLSAAGCWHVSTAASGVEALELVRRERPDAILLDVVMPGLDGPSTLVELFELGHTPPVIFLTGKAAAGNAGFLALGAVGVIAKPFDPAVLSAQVLRILGDGVRAGTVAAQ